MNHYYVINLDAILLIVFLKWLYFKLFVQQDIFDLKLYRQMPALNKFKTTLVLGETEYSM